jgi:uncharacterized protein (TIGR02646 family)
MRSIQKGDPPKDATGQDVVFEKYTDAAPHLYSRIGRYCSYCERGIPTCLAVEHKLPKSSDHYPNLELVWSNFLLACANCNSSKGTQEFSGVPPLWPDEDDTYSLIEYRESGAVVPRQGLAAPDAARAAALVRLVGLDKTPKTSTATDHRFFDRLEVFSIAKQAARDLAESDTSAMRNTIVNSAKGLGGYSIWRAVFGGDVDMSRRLAEAFVGTRLW